MSEYTIETRRRSRSKTPFLRSSCDHENCEHVGDEPHTHPHKKKVTSLAPQVKTIIEETVEVTSSSSVETGRNNPSKVAQTKTKTSDYSSEDSPENVNKVSTRALTTTATLGYTTQQQASVKETRTSTTVISKTTKSGGGSVATSTPKMNNYIKSFAAQFASRGDGDSSVNADVSNNDAMYKERQGKEHSQNLINTEKEINSSKNKSLSGFLGYSFGDKSINFNANDHMAYIEYKQVGEYWKKTPKTDYTYSELSPHRREIAPGIIAMPNMSRQSLDNHHERINYMIQRNPALEHSIRQRYESPKNYQTRKATERLAYDSGDEVDYSQYQSYTKKNESWLMRLITTIVTTITTTWSFLTGQSSTNRGAGMYTYSSSMYRTKLEEDRGFFGSIIHGISSAYWAIVGNIYMFISSVLYLDTWLLQSSNVDNRAKKRFLLFLLIILPLLLLTAWWLLDEKDRVIFAQRWHSLVPLSLITTLRSSVYTNFHTLQNFLPLFASSSSSSSHSSSQNMEDLKLSLSKSMPPEDYENILNHINSYIQNLVDIKLQEQKQLEKDSAQLSSKQIQTIVQIIKENMDALVRQKRFADSSAVLSDNEMNAIIEKITLKLQDSPNLAKTLILSPVNVAEIRGLVTEIVANSNSEHYKLIVEKLDLDALIAKLLETKMFTNHLKTEVSLQLSDQLQEKLLSLQQAQASGDDQYKLSLEQQKLLIDNLNKDIGFIKLALNDKLSENEGLHHSVKHLQQTQDVLLKRLQDLETSTDHKFANLLQEITLKLATLENEQFKQLNQQVKLSLIEILGFQATTKDGAQLTELDLQNWVRNMFVAKDYLELRLAEVNNRTNDKIKLEIDKSGMFLMRDISERLKQEIIINVENKQKETQAVLKGQIRDALSEEEVRNIVKSVLAIYDADKTGLVDFALESAGGQILSTRCTENYQTKTAQLSVFGIPLWYPTNTPRIAISPNVQPGECWAFQGFPGFLVLKLNSLVYVTGFTLEHIPRTLAPNGRIDSAPRNFTVWGLEHEKDQEPVLFGEYEYSDNNASLQYFPLQNKQVNRPYEIVELRIESNHGHPLYTCLYRFRVHGKPPAA